MGVMLGEEPSRSCKTGGEERGMKNKDERTESEEKKKPSPPDVVQGDTE